MRVVGNEIVQGKAMPCITCHGNLSGEDLVAVAAYVSSRMPPRAPRDPRASN